MVAGGIGLLLAITVNLKINLPITDSLLIWHVDFGIALFLIAVFHFSKHIKYYRNIFTANGIQRKAKEIKTKEVPPVQPRSFQSINLKWLPISLGFTSISTQLIMLREFLSVFNGNELTIGIVLASWMLLTGIGALMNRKSTKKPGEKGIMTGLFFLAIIPMVTLFLVYWLRNIVLPVGGQTNLLQVITGTVVLLAPFCLLSGWLFSALSSFLSKSMNQNAVSHTYGLETLGSIAGGILCSMILVFLFEPFQNLSIVFMLNSLILFLFSRKELFLEQKKIHIYLTLAAIILLAAGVANLDRRAIQQLFPEQKIISFKDTPYGKLVVTGKAGQLNFFENNTLLFTTNNIMANEETVHYALLQRQVSGNVLLVGGSISGVAQECLKYPLKRLDCAEMNPVIYKMGSVFDLLPRDRRFKRHTGDPRLLMNNSMREKTALNTEVPPRQSKIDSLSYDAIILNLPEPSTLQINRFYTLEFFRMCKNLLIQEGIITLSLGSTADYVGSDALQIQSTIYQTLKAAFKNVLVIPGEKNYFLASDGPLTSAVATLGTKHGIDNEYVNEYYLDDVSLQERSSSIIKRISGKAPQNHDFEPVGCYRQLHYWLSYQGNTGLYLLVLPLILLLLFAGYRSGGTTVALFSAGLSSFSIEIILILTFQVMYGYVYLAAGIFITLFMAGLAGGVFFAKSITGNVTYKSLIFMQILSVCILILSIVVIYLFSSIQLLTVLLYSIFSMLIISMAILTGIQFHLASLLKTGNIHRIASSGYSADLMGSATGAIVVNALIVPFFGFITALLVVASIGGVAIMLMLVKKQM